MRGGAIPLEQHIRAAGLWRFRKAQRHRCHFLSEAVSFVPLRGIVTGAARTRSPFSLSTGDVAQVEQGLSSPCSTCARAAAAAAAAGKKGLPV